MTISNIQNVWLRRALTIAWTGVCVFVVLPLLGVFVLAGEVLTGTANIIRDVRDFVKSEWTDHDGFRARFLDAWRGGQ